MSDDNFLSRWSRRKTQVRHGAAPPPEVPATTPVPPPTQAAVATAPTPPRPSAVMPASPAGAALTVPGSTHAGTLDPSHEPAHEPVPADPPPTLEDAARLTPQAADFSRFVRPDVSPEVQHSALKTLFADPHFNVMDGLDIYIDDYSRPDPLPPSMLRQMVQSKLLGLFDDEPQERPAETPHDENPDLQLQPDDAAGRADAGASPGQDPGRES